MFNPKAKEWVALVVDDTPDNLMLIKTVLSFRGSEVHTASSAEECYRILETVIPTFILLDIRMPYVDGWEVYHTIRSKSELAKIPIIAVTAYAMESDRKQILEGGFDGYISKPVDMVTLVDEIDKILQAHAGKQ